MRTLLLIVFIILQLSLAKAAAPTLFSTPTSLFIANRGQIINSANKPESGVKFYSGSVGSVQAYFTAARVSYVFPKLETNATQNGVDSPKKNSNLGDVETAVTALYRMDMEFVGANPKAQIVGDDESAEHTNYYLAHCPKGITHVPAYGKLIVKDIYPNIDVIWKTTKQGLKYEFIVRPGGNVRHIKMRYTGATTDFNSEVITAVTPFGSLRDEAPVSFQNVEKITTEFCRTGGNYGFKISKYDTSQTLIIDPMVVWGVFQNETVTDIGLLGMRVDADGNVIITGSAPTSTFPTTVGVIQPVYAGNGDCYIAKFDKEGIRKWATYYGGSGKEPIITNNLFTNCLALDANGNIVFTGSTASTDFPKQNPIQSLYGGGTSDMFIVKIFTKDGIPEWATYYGGSDSDQALGATVDFLGRVIVVGSSASVNFPTLGTVFQPNNPLGGNTGVLVKFNPAGEPLWATFCGDIASGVGSDYQAAVTTDNSGNIYTIGSTTNSFPTTVGTYQPVNASPDRKITVTKLDPNGQRLWATFHGRGIGNDIITDNTNLYIVGTSGLQGTFDVTRGPNEVKGIADVCVFTLDNTTGSRTSSSWSRLFGGTEQVGNWQYGNMDYGMNISFDVSGNLWVGGLAANSIDFPITVNSSVPAWAYIIQQGYGGGNTDGFFAEFNKVNGDALYCSHFGSISQDYGGYVFPYGSSNVFYGINSFNDGNAATFPIPSSRKKGTPYSVTIAKICTTTGLNANAGTDSVLCSGDTVQIGVMPASGISYNWNTRTNLSDSTVANPKAFLKNAGATPTLYKFNVLAADVSGCYGTDTVTLTVKPGPTVTSSAQPPKCVGSTVSYSLTGIYTTIKPDDMFKWEARGGNIIGDNTRQTVTVQWINVGTDTVYMTVTNGFGCSARARLLVDIAPLPIANAGPDIEICEDSTVIPLASASGGTGSLSYLWTPTGGVSSPTELLPTLKPTKPITDYVLTVTDTRGCIHTDTMRVIVNPKPIAFAGKDTVICLGESLQLSATARGGTPPYTVSWTPSVGLSSTDTSSPILTTPVSNKYVYHVTDAKGCKSRDTIYVQVAVKPEFTFDPPSLEFGQLDGCTSSTEKTISITNTNAVPGRLTGATSNDASFSVNNGFPISIPANQTIDIKIKFAPLTEGSHNTFLTFEGTPCKIILPINLRGEKLDLAVKSIPAGVDFGQSFTCSNRTDDTVITIFNTGTNILTIEQPNIQTPYSIISPASFPRSVKIGDSIKVTLRYAPVIDGNFSQTIRFPYSTGVCNDTIKISMNGESVPQNIIVNPKSVQFPLLVGCESFRDTIITIENTSALDIQVDSSIVGQTIRILSPAPPLTIKPNEVQQIKIRFEPTNSGVFSPNVQFAYSPCGKKDTVSFFGEKQGTSFAIADTIDAGEIIGCIKDFATVKLRIESTSTNGLDAEVISVMTGSTITTTMSNGVQLPNKTPIDFDVTITPVKDGVFLDSLIIVFNPCGISKTVYVKGLRTQVVLKADGPTVDFGKVQVGKNKTLSVFYTNTGSTPLTITTISNIVPPFSIIDTVPSLPAVLQPNDTLILTVEYVAVEGVQTAKVFAFGTTPCDASDSIIIQAEGFVPDSVQTSIKVADVSTETGDKIKLALVLVKEKGLAESGATKFSAKMRFNRTIVHITDPAFVCVGGSPPEICETELSGEYQTGQDTLGFIPVEATLGEVDSTIVELLDFKWLNGKDTVKVTRQNGVFRLTNICIEGGERLFIPTVRVSLSVTPNPTNGTAEIEYGVREKTSVKISLMDMLGRTVMVLDDAIREEGIYKQTVEFSTIDEGIYFLMLQCPNVVKTFRMSLTR